YYLRSAATAAHAQTEPWPQDCIEQGAATLQCFEQIVANLLRLIIPLAGVAAFVVLIVGGFQYLTSAGDPKQTQKAQSIITGAIIGIAATVGVWFIFRLLNTITGLDLLQFAVPQ
ncbi:hypothetical protein A2584_00145, partial [Candidatus Beckwithbacteria bacterium RIFOXYD1_FULL_50_11]